jgi:putative peptidoglycan lipid II flippase
MFGPEATTRVALALACLAPGLVAFSMNNIFARAYYALEDIKTPMKISLLCLMLNLVFSVWLVQRYREAGLAVANTLTAGLNLSLLAYGLRRKLGKLEMSELTRSLLVLIPAAALAGWVAWMIYGWWDARFGHGPLWSRLVAVFLPGAAAGAVYFGAALAGGVGSVREMFALVTTKFRRRVK